MFSLQVACVWGFGLFLKYVWLCLNVYRGSGLCQQVACTCHTLRALDLRILSSGTGRASTPKLLGWINLYRKSQFVHNFFFSRFWCTCLSDSGRTPKGSFSPRGRTRHLLETPFSEPLLRTLLRTLSHCKTHSRPPFLRTLLRSLPQTPFQNLLRTLILERCVAVRPPRRAPYDCILHSLRRMVATLQNSDPIRS